MQKIKKLAIIWIFICLLILVLYILFGPFLRISELDLVVDKDLKNLNSHKQKEDKLLSSLEKYKGQYLWKIDLKKLVEQTNSFYPGFTASAVRKFPNQLTVFLQKKTTVALLFYKDGFFSLSSQGDIGHKKNMKDSLDFPVLRGNIFWKKTELRKRALNILASIPKTNSFFSVQNVSEILHNETNNSLLFYLIKGYFILELSEPISPQKAKNVLFVLQYLDQKKEEGAWIDARPNKKIIVKRQH